MDSSSVIKVDTEQLRRLAKGYISHAGVVHDTWNSTKLTLDGIVRRMPAYDGRLQKAVHEDVLDFTTRSRDFFTWFQEDAASLIGIAEDFEIIDGQTIQVFQDADEITRASLIDAGKNLGVNTRITREVVTHPNGSISTITVVRTINDDGTITTTTYTHTVFTLSAETAEAWNAREADLKAFLSWGIGIATLPLEPVYGAIITTGAFIQTLYENHNPPRGWQAGDTITMDTTVIATESSNGPVIPTLGSLNSGPDITSKMVVTDSNDKILSESETHIDPDGTIH